MGLFTELHVQLQMADMEAADDSSDRSGGSGDHRPFTCQHCSRSYTKQGYLNRHLKKHDVYRYDCSKCSRKFYRRDQLVLHQQVHSDIRPFGCDLCHKQFKRRSALKRHRLSVHRHETSESANSSVGETAPASFTAAIDHSSLAELEPHQADHHSVHSRPTDRETHWQNLQSAAALDALLANTSSAPMISQAQPQYPMMPSASSYAPPMMNQSHINHGFQDTSGYNEQALFSSPMNGYAAPPAFHHATACTAPPTTNVNSVAYGAPVTWNHYSPQLANQLMQILLAQSSPTTVSEQPHVTLPYPLSDF